MEATYINTGHPDFISGHKAMALVSERMTANKPPPPAHDPKTGKLAPGTLNNGRDLDADLKKEDGFFGSFWPGGKKPMVAQNKKGAAAMDAVSAADEWAGFSSDTPLAQKAAACPEGIWHLV